MVANLFDFHYINYRFRSTEDLNCAQISEYTRLSKRAFMRSMMENVISFLMLRSL